MKSLVRISSSILCCCMVWGCVERDRSTAVQELIDQKMAERITVFSDLYMKNCKERELLRAKTTADSLVRAEVFLSPIDSLLKPPKPVKPQVPDFKRPRDTVSSKEDVDIR